MLPSYKYKKAVHFCERLWCCNYWNILVAGVGFEPTTFRLWAWRATGLLHPATKLFWSLLGLHLTDIISLWSLCKPDICRQAYSLRFICNEWREFHKGVFFGYNLICMPGGDLLSHALRHTTISAKTLNDRVRDGIGWGGLAIATRRAKKIVSKDIVYWFGKCMRGLISAHEH